jgi:hypothetical protein
MGGVRVRHRRWEQGKKTTDNVKSAGSAGKSRGVLRFDFWISCWQRKIYLSGATKLLRPALDELAPADCTVTWSFTDHHFSGPDMWVLHPSPAAGCILPEWDIRVCRAWAWPRDFPEDPSRARSAEPVSGAYWAPAGSGSDIPGRSLFRGILGARTRGAGPVGPRKVPPATVGWTPPCRFSPCAAALRREVGKGMWETPSQLQASAMARSHQGPLFERVSFIVRSPACEQVSSLA